MSGRPPSAADVVPGYRPLDEATGLQQEVLEPGRAGLGRWLAAVAVTARPRQWPKNLLVLAAPLAAASLGRDHDGGYALVAVVAFTLASAAVYFVNDVLDADRDRRHPAKRTRPVAASLLPPGDALAVAVVAAAAALSAGLVIGSPGLSLTVAAYLALSILYATVLKHVPVVELACIASGFVLRAVAGAAATHVAMSGWFLAVCSLGALMVAVSKRRTELALLGARAEGHRPAMRWYRQAALTAAARAVTAAMLVAYGLWALTTGNGWMQAWHAASIVPLAAALARFDWLNGRAAARPVEDLIVRDRVMTCAEASWLVLFMVGL